MKKNFLIFCFIKKINKQLINYNKHWECKLLMSLYRYAESSNHVMVFSEALYLNTLISVSSFNEDNHYKLYIAFGWSKNKLKKNFTQYKMWFLIFYCFSWTFVMVHTIYFIDG